MIRPLKATVILSFILLTLSGCMSISMRDDDSTAKKLDRPISLRADGDKLEIVLEWFREVVGVNMVISFAALELTGVEADAPVELDLHRLPARRVLEMILLDVNSDLEPIGFEVRENIVRISTVRDLQQNKITRHYDLTEILRASPLRWTMVHREAPWITLSPELDVQNAPTREELIEQFTTLIQDTVGRSGDWAAYGGEVSSIREFKSDLRVVATEARHGEIMQLHRAMHEQLHRQFVRTEREKEIVMRLAAANELRLREAYDAALKETDKALALVPAHPVALAMKEVIQGTQLRQSSQEVPPSAPASIHILSTDGTSPDASVQALLSRQDQEVWKKLETLISVDFNQTTIKDAMAYVVRQLDVNTYIHWRELESIGLEKDAPITLKLSKAPAATVLQLLMEKAGADALSAPLGFDVRDGVVLVSSIGHLSKDTVTEHFDITDLLAWPLDALTLQTFDSQPGEPGEPGERDNNEEAMSPEDMLENIMTIILDQIGRQSAWQAYGGEHFSLRELHGMLIIKTLPRHQAEVAVLLNIIRSRLKENLMRTLAQQAITPLLTQADGLRANEDYHKALKLVEKALTIRPDHPQANAMKIVLKEIIQRGN